MGIFTETDRNHGWTLEGERTIKRLQRPTPLGRSGLGRLLGIPQGEREKVVDENFLDSLAMFLKDGDLGFSHPDL